jgi:hypothetical protein
VIAFGCRLIQSFGTDKRKPTTKTRSHQLEAISIACHNQSTLHSPSFHPGTPSLSLDGEFVVFSDAFGLLSLMSPTLPSIESQTKKTETNQLQKKGKPG